MAQHGRKHFMKELRRNVSLESSVTDTSDDVGLVYTSDRFGRVRFPPSFDRFNEKRSTKEQELKAAPAVYSAPNDDGSVSPLPLYQLCLEFVARNIELVESLKGFPAIVGQQLFEKVHKCGGFIDSKMHSLRLFFEAYGELVLKNLSLSAKHVLANEKLPDLLPVSCLRDLDLSHCRLGSDHELWSCIAKLECLQRLSLKDNCLADDSVARMSLPHRLLGLGLRKLVVLDLSCNPCVTDNCIKCLARFPPLRALNLSGTAVTLAFGVPKLVSATDLKLTSKSTEFQKEFTVTEGWAAVIIHKWIEQAERTPSIHHSQGLGARGFYQTNTSRMKGAQQVASKPSFCGQFIFLEAKKTDSGSLEKCIPNHRTTSEKLFGKRKLSPLLSSKTKRQNNSSLAPDCVDSDNELAFLNDYLVNVDSKESVTSAGDGPSSLIDALDKGVGPAPKTRQPDWW